MLRHRLFVYTIKEHSTALLIELDETLAGAIKRIDQQHAFFFVLFPLPFISVPSFLFSSMASVVVVVVVAVPPM